MRLKSKGGVGKAKVVFLMELQVRGTDRDRTPPN